MLKLFNNIITCFSYVTRVFHCMRLQMEPNGFFISCFHMLVAECITFDVYSRTWLPHSRKLIVIVSYSYITIVIVLFCSNRSSIISLSLPVVTWYQRCVKDMGYTACAHATFTVTHYLCVKCGELSMKVVWRAGMAMVWRLSCDQLRSKPKLSPKREK